MFADIATSLSRSPRHLIEDVLGLAALAVVLIGGLHLPGLI